MVVSSPTTENKVGRPKGPYVAKPASRTPSSRKRTQTKPWEAAVETVTKKRVRKGKKKVVHTNNKTPTQRTKTNSKLLRLHTNGVSVDFNTDHIQQCYIDKNEIDYQKAINEIDIDLSTFMTVINPNNIITNHSYYHEIN